MAGRGGKRPGAGRKPQSKMIKKVDPAVINAGILPLEARLLVFRKMWAEAVDTAGEIINLVKAKEAAEFGEAAMQYTSAKLQSVFMSAPNGGPVEHKHTVISEVDAMIADEMKRAGRPSVTKH